MSKNTIHSFKLKGVSLFIISLFIISPLIVAIPAPVSAQQVAQLSDAERAQLQNQLNQLEADLAEKQKELDGQKSHSSTLQGEVNRIKAQISAKTTEIALKSKKIVQLSNSIGEKKSTIVTLSDKIEKQKQSLAQLLRKTNEMDQATLTTFLVSSSSLSDFYSDVSNFENLRREVKASVDEIQQIKGITEIKKSELEKEQNQTVDEKSALESVKISLNQDQKTQNQLLSISKNKEAEYKKLIAEQQKQVAAIKARLFQLAGGSSAIRFDLALQYANEASNITNVDPAYILAELTQESNLGANVGKCYLTDTDTGAGINVNGSTTYKNVMKASRDVTPFLDITNKLGYDWSKTVVSCPIAGVAGYGGAMGPAQFIPSTWKTVQSRIENIYGRASNPWSAQDAFLASALYLADLGGTGSSTSAQLRASCRYYGSGGSTCSYGRSVQSLKTKIQADIDYLEEYGISRR